MKLASKRGEKKTKFFLLDIVVDDVVHHTRFGPFVVQKLLCNLGSMHVSHRNIVNDHFTNRKWNLFSMSIGGDFRYCCVYISIVVRRCGDLKTILHLVQFTHMLNTARNKVLRSFWEKCKFCLIYTCLSKPPSPLPSICCHHLTRVV